jgi:ATP-dependent DNA helicase RecQ
VLVLRVADPARQAAAIVQRMQLLHDIGGGSWRDFAVLARRHDLLQPIRSLCEAARIPVRISGDLPPLHRIREIHAFLAALKARGQELLRPDQLTELLPTRPSPWRDFIADLITDWHAELSGTSNQAAEWMSEAHPPTTSPDARPLSIPEPTIPKAHAPSQSDDATEVSSPSSDEPSAADSLAVPAAEIAEFCWETLAELRRERSIGDGVLLATLHAAKGLEFPHVLIADGGWDKVGPSDAEAEDERRTFYVGMTRARETLTLLEIAGGGHLHLPLLGPDQPRGRQPSIPNTPAPGDRADYLLRDEPIIEAPAPEVIRRRYCRLTPADLDLGYAGRQAPNAPIHRYLADLQAGASLGWRAEPIQLLLTTSEGHPVARLSKRAAAHWLPRSDRIETIRVLAMLQRDRTQTEPDYAPSLRCDAWEVPIVEIRWRGG